MIDVRGDAAHGLSIAPGEEVLRFGVLEERVATAIEMPPSLRQQGRDPVGLPLVEPPWQANEGVALSAAAYGPNFGSWRRRLGRCRRALAVLLRRLSLRHLPHLRSPRKSRS